MRLWLVCRCTPLAPSVSASVCPSPTPSAPSMSQCVSHFDSHTGSYFTARCRILSSSSLKMWPIHCTRLARIVRTRLKLQVVVIASSRGVFQWSHWPSHYFYRLSSYVPPRLCSTPPSYMSVSGRRWQCITAVTTVDVESYSSITYVICHIFRNHVLVMVIRLSTSGRWLQPDSNKYWDQVFWELYILRLDLPPFHFWFFLLHLFSLLCYHCCNYRFLWSVHLSITHNHTIFVQDERPSSTTPNDHN